MFIELLRFGRLLGAAKASVSFSSYEALSFSTAAPSGVAVFFCPFLGSRFDGASKREARGSGTKGTAAGAAVD